MITRHLASLSDTGSRIFLGALLLVALYVSIGNLLMPEDSLFHVPTHVVALTGKYLCYAILAVALDLVWGYCGIL
ncbi:MAG: urea ABC transporter permease subunit UrtC, partial [Hyphomicrobiaceae bacterium]